MNGYSYLLCLVKIKINIRFKVRFLVLYMFSNDQNCLRFIPEFLVSYVLGYNKNYLRFIAGFLAFPFWFRFVFNIPTRKPCPTKHMAIWNQRMQCTPNGVCAWKFTLELWTELLFEEKSYLKLKYSLTSFIVQIIEIPVFSYD